MYQYKILHQFETEIFFVATCTISTWSIEANRCISTVQVHALVI